MLFHNTIVTGQTLVCAQKITPGTYPTSFDLNTNYLIRYTTLWVKERVPP